MTVTVVVAREPAQPPQVAYRVGRPVGGAVVRNRVRRRLREAVRAQRHSLRPGYAYLVGASPGAASRSTAELTELVGRALRHLDDTSRGEERAP